MPPSPPLLPASGDAWRSPSWDQHIAHGRHQRSTFIHVAKAGGTSVQASLFKSNVTMNDEHTRQCFPSNQVCQVHARQADPSDMVDAGVKVFILIRDPVNRAISAFNWRNPRDGAPWLRGMERHTPGEKQMYRCFDHIRELAAALRGASGGRP